MGRIIIVPGPERIIFSTPERQLTGLSLLGSSENDRIRVTRMPLEDGITRYEVRGFLDVGRAAISAIMATPLHYSGEKWQEVRDGLRDVSTPSRGVKAAQRNTDKRLHLKNVGPAARELADTMTNNQAYRAQSANVPVYTASESLAYTNDEILERMGAEKLVVMLKSIGVDAKTARQLSEFAYFSNKADEATQELEAVTGLSVGDMHRAENSAMLAQVDSRVWSELVYRLQEKMFVGFKQEAMFKDNQIHFKDDPSVFILESDLPDNIVATKLGTSVDVVRKIRKDRETDPNRYRVDFLTDAPKISAQPKIVWEKQGHRRRFVYPVSEFEHGFDGNVARPSSLLGAALAANYGRLKYAIPYSGTLGNRMFPPGHRLYSFNYGNYIRHGAGLLPLVINQHEATLLKDDYFTSIEEVVE